MDDENIERITYVTRRVLRILGYSGPGGKLSLPLTHERDS